jgi:methionyl aminopeptidase
MLHANPHNISINDSVAIEKMRIAGQLAAEVLMMIEPYVIPGISTNELDKLCHDHITTVQHAIPAPLNYHGFPKSICTSINYQVCHGIPGERQLKDGDIVNIDITVIKDGYHGDTSKMFSVGNISKSAELLMQVTQECLYLGIKEVAPGKKFNTIGAAIEAHATAHNFTVVHEYCGHGIGLEFHEPPNVLHYHNPHSQEVMQPGMIFTIEPMINAGKRHVKLLADNWTVVTKDHSLSAQWEHTILVTPTGYEVLTKRSEEQF